MLENKLAPNQKNKKHNEPIILRYHTFLFLYFRSKKDAKLRTNEWKKRNLYPLYSSSSLSLSLDSRLKTNEGKKGKGRKEDTKWRELPQTMGGREEEEEKKCGTKRNGERKREREREAHVCVSYESTQYVNSRWWPHQETCSPLEEPRSFRLSCARFKPGAVVLV